MISDLSVIQRLATIGAGMGNVSKIMLIRQLYVKTMPKVFTPVHFLPRRHTGLLIGPTRLAALVFLARELSGEGSGESRHRVCSYR